MSKPRQEFTKAVKLARWQHCAGFCEWCDGKLYPGKYEFHHDKEDTFRGKPDFDNCRVLCKNCHGQVTADQATVIAKSNRVRNKHLGIAKPRGRWGYGKAEAFKKKISGEVVRR